MKKLVSIVFVLATLLTPGCSFVAELADPYPTDAELEKRFKENREAFDELVQMFQENAELWQFDSDGKALLDFNKPASLPQTRTERYSELMKQTGILSINRNHSSEGEPPRPAIYMKVWQVPNMVIGTKSKLYVYKLGSGTNLVESLDKSYRSGQDANDSKKINEDWSLYLDIW